MTRVKTLILGAAGTDFHTFNTVFRDNDKYEVVAFTATQIPDIEGRQYPASLAGSLYPKGIPIFAEEDAPELINKHKIELVILAYSDLKHDTAMHKGAIANANGADFQMFGTKAIQIKSTKPVISICAVRTGCGKSQTTRLVADYFTKKGMKVVAIRHPMPYGDLEKQKVQRYADYSDLDKHECTIEEREEYEPHIDRKTIVYAGVDYGAILKEAEKEADIILWDGGNNDVPYYVSDLQIVIADAKRPNHEMLYYPGETNFRMADVLIINKMGDATEEGIAKVKDNIKKFNPNTKVIYGASVITAEKMEELKGKKALIVEDGPTTTHGDLNTGAGTVLAIKAGVSEFVDPRPYAVRSIKKTFEKYPHITALLPAMGYGKQQIKDLEETINAVDCEVVIGGTPIDLTRLVKVNKPLYRVRYEYGEVDNTPNKLVDILEDFYKQL